MSEFPKPARFHLEQEQWDATPDVMKSEIHRMIRELTAGLERCRSASKRNDELKEYHELAERQGTTIVEAMTRYVAMENAIRADPVAGISKVLENLGLDPVEFARRYLATPQENAA